VDTWTLIRLLHVVALVFFVGGQLMLVLVVLPAVRRHGAPEPVTRALARRFGVAAGVSVVVLVATGAALAGHLSRWDDPVLQAKLALLVLVGVLIGLHIASPESRAVSLAMLAASLAIVALGLALAHG
jgi:uncharacterized membrane protein